MKRIALLCLFLICTLIAWGETLYDDTTVLADDESQVLPSPEVGQTYDLVVYGGDPEGVVAALAGARNGLKTLLVMEEDGPGGLIVYGALNFLDLNYDDKGRNIHKGIFAEWHKMVGGDVVVDIEDARQAFMQMLLVQPNLTIVPVSRLRGFELSEDGRQLHNLVFETTGISKTHDPALMNRLVLDLHPGWKIAARSVQQRAQLLHLSPGTFWKVEAKRVIDASQDADLAAMVGVPYFFGGTDIGLPDRKMAVTLVFRVKDVDWKALEADIKSQRWGYSRHNATAVWGMGDVGANYQPVDRLTRLRGLNIARQKDGTLFINALLIFNLDVLDPAALGKGMEQGKAESAHVVEYLRRELRGFENAQLMEFPPQLYVRESRHILALYQLDVLDLVEKVDFPDKIALSSYPIDFQASQPETPGYVICTPGVYTIPFRSLVPRNLVNLLVVGRAAGYSSLAAGSARVIPTGMATAEAAGVAAAISLEAEVEFHELAASPVLIKTLQQRLVAQGANLQKINGSLKLVHDPDYEVLKELFGWGMLSAGYNNDLRLEQVITEREFVFLLTKGLRQRKAPTYSEYLVGGLYSLTQDRPLDRYKASELLLVAHGYKYDQIDDVYLQALKEGFFTGEMEKSLKNNRPLTRRDIYKLAVTLWKRYPVQETLYDLRSRSFAE